jgi:hypothetical protein
VRSSLVSSVPEDFLRVLRRSGLDEFFLECPYVHRADYLNWIAATKRPSTRRLRIQKAVVRLFAQWTEEMNAARAEFLSVDSPPAAVMTFRERATDKRSA